MPRASRIVAIKEAHLVYQRAGRPGVFSSDKDRQSYLEILKGSCEEHKLDVLAYCLVRDGAYLVVRPRSVRSIELGIGRAQFSYAHYLKRKGKSIEGLWRNRFQSCPVDKKKLWTVVQFVECQPVYSKAGAASSYKWSSAKAHITGKDPYDLLALDVWPEKRYRKQWASLLRKSLSKDVQEYIRVTLQTGRPWGSDAFIKSLERKYKRRLRALPIGRPVGT
ncbi:MAG: transposase [Planctomycetes bacterium]|nr:transposase [Planctomycetota bacterium]